MISHEVKGLGEADEKIDNLLLLELFGEGDFRELGIKGLIENEEGFRLAAGEL